MEATPLPGSNAATPETPDAASKFDPAAVSEVVWCQWRSSVIRHSLGKEALGRFAPSLKNMTRVVWNSTLDTYAAMTLAEIRALKTHGEKRVRAILEVFHGVHALVSNMGVQEHLVLRIVPCLIDKVETWVGQALQTPGVPAEKEIFDAFVNPLLTQIQIDATRQIASLAENRLGINGPVTSVRQAARTMGLTRARVYQLLNEINDIMNVRWPLGRHQVYELSKKLHADSKATASATDLRQFAPPSSCFIPAAVAGPQDRWSVLTSTAKRAKRKPAHSTQSSPGPP